MHNSISGNFRTSKVIQKIKDDGREANLSMVERHQHVFREERHCNDLIFAQDTQKIIFPRLCMAFEDRFRDIDSLKLSQMAS